LPATLSTDKHRKLSGGRPNDATFFNCPVRFDTVLTMIPSTVSVGAGRASSSKQFPASVQLQGRMHEMNRLNEKAAVITGGATGIARAVFSAQSSP
jgi:hypothetical protein